jgi:SPP1 gp7 family putative phage head morphogenesis protein
MSLKTEKNANNLDTHEAVPQGLKTRPKIVETRIISPALSPRDLQAWRNAWRAAENAYYPNTAQLYDIYQDFLSADGHLRGIVQKRIDSVLNKRVHYVDAAGKKIDGIDALIESSAFRLVMRTILETIFWGVSGIECPPAEAFTPLVIPRKHIKLKTRCIAIEQTDQDGIKYDDNPYIYVTGQYGDLGLLLSATYYAILKRAAWGDWANYLELYGHPIRVARYDGLDERLKQELFTQLEKAGSSLSIVIPKQADIEIMDGKSSNGDGKLQHLFKDSCNAEMSIVILGNTETSSQSAHGSNAKAKTHSEQQNEIIKSDIAYLQSCLNDPKFISILKLHGYPVVEGGKFQFPNDVDLEELQNRLEIDLKLKQAGLPIADDYFYGAYGVPKPDDYDAQKNKSEPEPQQPNPDAPADKPKPQNQAAPKRPKSDPVRLYTPTANTAGGDVANPFALLKTSFKNLLKTLFTRPKLDVGKLYAAHGAKQVPNLSADEAKWDAIVSNIAREIYDAKAATGAIPQAMYEKTADTLMKAMYGGMGGNNVYGYDDPNNKLKSVMQANIFQFSGAKSLAEMQEFNDLLLDKNGKAKNFTNFRNDCLDAGKKFNVDYLETEYQTALNSAENGVSYNSYGDDEYIQLSAAPDDLVCHICAPYDGLTRKKSEGFWKQNLPPLHYNCRCTIIPAHKQERSGQEPEEGKKRQKLFKNNSGEGIIFENGFPYDKEGNGKKNLAWDRNYDMHPIGLIYNEKNKWPALPNLPSKDDADQWWKDKAGTLKAPLNLVDVNKITVQLAPKLLVHATEENDDERWRYLPAVEQIVTDPDEIWNVLDGTDVNTTYIKYYDKYPVKLFMRNNQAVTFYGMDKDPKYEKTNQARHGILLFRKE